MVKKFDRNIDEWDEFVLKDSINGNFYRHKISCNIILKEDL